MMLRVTSEIAVAISVASIRLNPSSSASARAWARTATRSSSDAISICTSAAIATASLRQAVQQLQALLEVESRSNRLEIEPEAHHRHRPVGLDPDDHRLRPAETRHERDRPQRPGDERVDDVECPDVDDDAARAMASDSLGEVVPKGEYLSVAQGILDRRDQVLALLQDRHGHRGAHPSTSSPRSGASLA